MNSLTPKQQKVFDYLRKSTDKNGFPPSYSEIQEHFGLKSIRSVQQFVEQLKLKGFIDAPIGEQKKRAIEILQKDNSEIVSIPLEGRVAAGKLTEAVHNREFVDIPRALMKSNSEYFALRVKGDSMIEDCIMDGDLVVIKRVQDASNGQTVVALVDDDATIKRFYKRKGKIELHPANPNFDIITIEPESDFKILGVLASVIRQCE